MSPRRGGVAIAAAALVAAVAAVGAGGAGCGSSGGKPDGGAAGGDGAAGRFGMEAAAGDVDASHSGSDDADARADQKADQRPDLATDFGPISDAPTRCPTAAGALPATDPALTIDAYEGTGRLDGRIRSNGVFTVKEQFDASGGGKFDPVPAIDEACGAAAPGAAHIRGRAASPGATYALVFSSPMDGGGPRLDHYDASGTKGVSFRIALGDASSSKLVTLQVNLAGSKWDYTKDVAIGGTTWQTVTVMWSDLDAAPGAPTFDATALNQLVFPFSPDTDVDVFLDDLAFVK